MLEVGRLCVKTAGRDAAEYCVVVEVLDEKYVLVEGNTRRKKVSTTHLEPTTKVLDVKKGADRKAVGAAFEKEGIALKVKGDAKKPKPQTKKSDAKADDKKKKTTKKVEK